MTVCGVTGASGFIGSHLVRRLAARNVPCVVIGREDFADTARLYGKTARCDAIVHFAGLSRHEDGDFLYRVNLGLGEKLVACARSIPGAKPKLFLASTTHIGRDTEYHRSKRDLARLFENSGKDSAILLMPNTFGPGGKVFYNSVVSTFCFLSAAGKVPEKIDDVMLDLIYVETLVDAIIDRVLDPRTSGTVRIADEYHESLPRLWETLCALATGKSPATPFEKNLADTRAWYSRNGKGVISR
ncbi:MAG: NAD-dependent epimerase/dehydratase family protein [Victivallaceae bacterium]|nr:NAD-dependent epimerase/dehydratase family protein [Victivallaceae bacterium]